MSKYIMINSKCYGKIGEQVPFKYNPIDSNLYVGDLIVFEYDNKIYCRPIMKNNNCYGIYGFGVNHFRFNKIKKLANYTVLNEELLKSCHGEMHYKKAFEIIEAKKMTLTEIEKKLGYKIELI